MQGQVTPLPDHLMPRGALQSPAPVPAMTAHHMLQAQTLPAESAWVMAHTSQRADIPASPYMHGPTQEGCNGTGSWVQSQLSCSQCPGLFHGLPC